MPFPKQECKGKGSKKGKSPSEPSENDVLSSSAIQSSPEYISQMLLGIATACFALKVILTDVTTFWKVDAQNAWCSNWFDTGKAVTYVFRDPFTGKEKIPGGLILKTAEHAIMIYKALLFDRSMIASIVEAPTPERAKKLGREVRNFDKEVWDQVIDWVAYEVLIQKFSQSEECKHLLLQTGNSVLVEASPVDTIWGAGLNADKIKTTPPSQWRGENKLGFALMAIRDALRSD
jgi:ribA/ribD-fused uncharacterized protein